ncbi:AAA family ATPase [Metabacillus bambusae]|uniref:AAA family ATPase n=1 Tax=Metabacillus bambusae TaxID=2795218 RepID=A0ABS3N1M5_9BACI|nr:AAA family ATPase [Metabacillus bambusae]MBO1511823.1 AAA family ATPase [Metabacillus bambusae]
MSKGNTIYIISGPCGVGKSTVSKEIARMIKRSVLIEGDLLNAMIVGDSELTWEERLEINWSNILSMTRNVVQHDYHVVIDYVVETELEWFCQQVSDMNVQIKYVVLRANEAKLIERLNKRGDPFLIERSLFLIKEFEESSLHQLYLLDTTDKQPLEVAKEIVLSACHHPNFVEDW